MRQVTELTDEGSLQAHRTALSRRFSQHLTELTNMGPI
jgi:hypothetical protein